MSSNTYPLSERPSLVHSLPPELISRILEHTIDDVDVLGDITQTLPWTLMSVCKTFRTLISTTPPIWTHLRFSARLNAIQCIASSDFTSFRKTEVGVLQRMATCFTNAGSLPVQISFSTNFLFAFDSIPGMNQLSSYLYCVRTFHESGYVSLRTLTESTQSSPTPVNLPNLRDLTISCTPNTGSRWREPGARMQELNIPNLTHLTLWGYPLDASLLGDCWRMAPTTFTNLRAFTLSNCEVDFQGLVDLLSRLRRLEDLALIDTVPAHGSPDGSWVPGAPRLVLHNLTSFKISFSDPRFYRILQAFMVPALTTLDASLSYLRNAESARTNVDNALVRLLQASNASGTLQTLALASALVSVTGRDWFELLHEAQGVRFLSIDFVSPQLLSSLAERAPSTGKHILLPSLTTLEIEEFAQACDSDTEAGLLGVVKSRAGVLRKLILSPRMGLASDALRKLIELSESQRLEIVIKRESTTSESDFTM